MEYTDTIIMIPARLGSSRLPNKPLLKINGIPLIIHAYNCAKNAKLNAPVVVATDDKLIFKTVSEYGGTALMTSHQHESGSDRILEALEKFDHEKKYKNIIHLQGDLPNISGNLIKKLAQVANDPLKEITTVIVKASPDEFDDPSVDTPRFDASTLTMIGAPQHNLAQIHPTPGYCLIRQHPAALTTHSAGQVLAL